MAIGRDALLEPYELVTRCEVDVGAQLVIRVVDLQIRAAKQGDQRLWVVLQLEGDLYVLVPKHLKLLPSLESEERLLGLIARYVPD